MSDEFDESPLAGRRSYESAYYQEGTSDEPAADKNNSAAPMDDEDGEDVPNWIAFADFAKSASKGKSSLKEPIIPKRGEKDFEPASEDRYIDLQDSLLEASRSALFSAISSGTRHHSSKGPNRAIWDPLLERAYMVHVSDPSLPPFASSSSSSSSETPHAQDNNPNAAAVHGIHFSTVGKFVQERKRLELMPEEALYLIERGSIECWTSEDETAVPLSVQHAWAVMISAGKLTPERYQVYAFLKRLGYTVVRSDTVPNPVNRKEGLHHATFVSTKAWIHNAFTTIFYPAAVLLRRIKHTIAPYTLTALERLDSIANGQRQSLLGSERWSTYDQVFTSLQFISSGKQASCRPNMRQNNPYRVFYNVYKPITKYKKTDPPPPDFRIGAISAQTTPIPDLYDFENIYAELEETPSPASTSHAQQDRNKGSSLIQDIYSLLKYLLPNKVDNNAYAATTGGRPTKNRFSASLTRPAPYAKLKNGSKSAIIAVVDNGTISFQRFGQTAFAELPWVGDGTQSA